MRPRVTTLLPLLFSTALLTGCSTPGEVVTVTEYVDRKPPPALLSCGEEPRPPVRPAPGQPRDQRAVALYIVEILEWGRGCWRTVESIGDLYSEEQP